MWPRSATLGILFWLALAGCGYELTFTCGASAGAACPEAQTCPTLPLASGGCDDLPALLGHPSIGVDSGRPIGCVAGLTYGNPYYGGDQVLCTCGEFGSPQTPTWSCPL